MIQQEILTEVRNGICAIGYVTVPVTRFTEDMNQPFFKVLGTGFLVRPDIAITNRHVIQSLLDQQADLGFLDEQRLLLFVRPRGPNTWQVFISGVVQMGYVEIAELDVGFVTFARPQGDEFADVTALHTQPEMTFSVSEPVAVYGYPYGHAMLQKDRKVYRWGPVLQQGYISAISPFDNASLPNELLLDVRIAGGMSGAPVFRPSDGTVVGIVHSAWEATTALALPLNESLAEQLLARYNEKRAA